MANIKAYVKRGLLQSLYDGMRLGNLNDFFGVPPTQPAIDTLENALITFQQFSTQWMLNGKIITGSAGYQHSTQFAKPEIWMSFTPEQLYECAQEFREIYTDAFVALEAFNAQNPNNDPPITDAAILSTMMADDRLQRVTSTQKDYTTLRMPWSRLS